MKQGQLLKHIRWQEICVSQPEVLGWCSQNPAAHFGHSLSKVSEQEPLPPDFSGIARSLEVSHTMNTSLSWDRGGSRQIKQGEHQNKRAAMLSQAETTVFCGDVQRAALYVDTLLSSSAALIYCIFIHKCPCWELFLHAHSLSITFPETQQHLQQRFHCVTAVSLRWPWVWDIYQQGNKTKRLKKKKTATVCNNLFVKVARSELTNYRQTFCICYGSIKASLSKSSTSSYASV